MGEVIRVERRHKVGTKSFGYTYSLHSYRKIVDKFKARIKNNEVKAELFIGLSHKDYILLLDDPCHGMRNIDKENSCGNIVEVTNTYIDIEVDNPYIKKLFEVYDNIGVSPKASMRYLAEKSFFKNNKIVQLQDIITFDIIFPKVDIENHSFDLTNTVKELYTDFKGVCVPGEIYIDKKGKK